MTTRTRRSSVQSTRVLPTAIAAALASLSFNLAPPRALAGAPITPYPAVADIDKDGQPGGVSQPRTIDELSCNPLLAVAVIFAGQDAVVRLRLDNNPRFQVEIATPTAFAPTDAQAADIDCDGIDDLVLCNFESLFTVPQDTCGVFDPPTPAASVGGQPFAENCVKLADLGGNQCPEIVAVSNNFTTPPQGLIQVFPNNGAGVFAAPTTVSIPNTTLNGNAVGDIDDDEVADVAVITSSGVSILRRTAPNTLTPLNAATGQPLAPADPFSLSQNTFPTGLFEVSLTDVNNDGRDDIVTSNLNDVFIRTSTSNGTFGPIVTLDGNSGTRNVIAADLTADGTAEILAVNNNDNVVYLWPSTGVLQWGARQDIPVGTSPAGVQLADTNADNLLDMIVLNRIDGDAEMFLNKGAAVFIVPQRFSAAFATAGGYTSVASGDFNGDGHTDVFASTQRGDLDLFLNRADGSGLLQDRINRRITFNPFVITTLPPPPGLPGGPRDRVAAGILNSDTINIRRYDAANPPSNPYTSDQVINSTGNTVTSITTCDLNADNITDIAVTLAGSAPAAQVFLGDAAGQFGNPVALTLPTAGWDQFIVPPANSGLPANRYYIGDYQTGTVLPLDFSAGAFLPSGPITFGNNCTDFAMGDIDGDGTADLIATRTGTPTGELVVRSNITSPVPPPATSLPLPRNPAGLAVGDINADGKPDVTVSTAGPTNQNQYVMSILNSGTALDPATAALHPAGERPARPILVDLHATPTTRGTPSPLDGPEVVIPNRDATGFNFNASVIVLPNQINFAPPSPACRADFNTDGVVSTPDLVFFLGRFGQPATPGSQAARADFNGDGVVNTPDLVFFLGRFGETCP
jgi:hypothetical protein